MSIVKLDLHRFVTCTWQHGASAQAFVGHTACTTCLRIGQKWTCVHCGIGACETCLSYMADQARMEIGPEQRARTLIVTNANNPFSRGLCSMEYAQQSAAPDASGLGSAPDPFHERRSGALSAAATDATFNPFSSSAAADAQRPFGSNAFNATTTTPPTVYSWANTTLPPLQTRPVINIDSAFGPRLEPASNHGMAAK